MHKGQGEEMSFCRTFLLHGKRKNACMCEGCINLIVPGTEIADPSEDRAKDETDPKVPVPEENGSQGPYRVRKG